MTEKVFHNRIVIAVSVSGHALDNSMFFQKLTIRYMAVLPALIGVQYPFASISQMFQCFFQHIHYKGKNGSFFDLITNDFPII